MINRFEYEVIDQLVPSSMSDWIEQRLIEYGPWLYNSATSQLGAKFDPNDKNIVDSPQFTNALFTQEEGVCSELYSEVAQPIFWFLEKEIGIKVEQLVRIKANLLMPAEQNINHYHYPHIDHTSEECLSLIYYVNDSDGDTRLFDKYAVEDGHVDLKIVHSNTPKKGSALMFQSGRLHASSNPIKNDKRCIINFIFKPTDDSYKKYLDIKNSS